MAVGITGHTALLRVVRRLMASNGAKTEPRSCPDLGAFGSHFRRKPPIRANGLVRGELTPGDPGPDAQISAPRRRVEALIDVQTAQFGQRCARGGPSKLPRSRVPPLAHSLAGAASTANRSAGALADPAARSAESSPGGRGARPPRSRRTMPGGQARLQCRSVARAVWHAHRKLRAMGPQTKRSLRIPTGPSSRPRCPV